MYVRVHCVGLSLKTIVDPCLVFLLVRLVVEQGLTMVHPFDDPLVIAGQGTIAMEIMKV